MKKILVPLDFSPPSIAALGVACQHAEKINASVLVLHVVEEYLSESFRLSGEIIAPTGVDSIYTYKLLEASRRRLKKLILNPKYASVKVEGELRMGNPFHAMSKIIEENEKSVDLVVMGVKGHSQFEKMIIGSNTEKVIRHAKVPVLTISKKKPTTRFKNIVYATTLSKKESKFFSVVNQLQEVYKSKIHLLYVNTPVDFQRYADTQRSMEKFAKNFMLQNYTINVFSDFSEEEGILHFANSVHADLIAMVTHGRTGFAHVLAGSITEDVVQYSKRPVLTWVLNK